MTLRLLVIGDTLLDRDVVGRVERICPDAPVPVVDVAEVRERPGGAGLAALLACRPGVEVTLATGLGNGRSSARVHELLRTKVELHDVRPGTPIPCKTRVRANGQSLLRLDDEGALLGDSLGSAGVERLAAGEPPIDTTRLRRLLRRCDAVLVSDYGGPVTRAPAVRALLTRHATTSPVVWDPHPRGAQPIAGVTVTPNRLEAQNFSAQPGADLSVLAATLRDQWRARAVCITDGERGAVTALDGGPVLTTCAVPCPDGTDTCGAGDRFAAGLAVALAHGMGPADAVARAQQDVGRWLLDGGVSAVAAGGAVDDPSADELVERVRQRGGTVVATGGCFDVLHAGHLALLEHARSLGDCLVVLLNSDASVRRLKGATRPVHAVADRARLLEGLACVDAVAVFEDDDPIATLARLRPHVWVKGGDYREQDLPEARTVRALGGRIALVPYLEGHSTTRILQHVAAGSPSTVDETGARTNGVARRMTATTEGDTR